MNQDTTDEGFLHALQWALPGIGLSIASDMKRKKQKSALVEWESTYVVFQVLYMIAALLFAIALLFIIFT